MADAITPAVVLEISAVRLFVPVNGPAEIICHELSPLDVVIMVFPFSFTVSVSGALYEAVPRNTAELQTVGIASIVTLAPLTADGTINRMVSNEMVIFFIRL